MGSLMGGGVFYIDLKTGKVNRCDTFESGKEYQENYNVLHNRWVASLLYTSNNKLYIGKMCIRDRAYTIKPEVSHRELPVLFFSILSFMPWNCQFHCLELLVSSGETTGFTPRNY